MFEAAYVAIAAAMVNNQMEAYEEKTFQEMLLKLPIQDQCAAIKDRADRKEKARLEAREERMHRELCDAIKQSGRTTNYVSGSSYGSLGGASSLALGILLGESFKD